MMWPLIGIVSIPMSGHIIGFGWEMGKLLWKPFCSLFLNCSPDYSEATTKLNSADSDETERFPVRPLVRVYTVGGAGETFSPSTHRLFSGQRRKGKSKYSLLLIPYKFVKSFWAITFLLLLISSWNVHDMRRRFLCSLIRNFSWICQKTKNFPIDPQL